MRSLLWIPASAGMTQPERIASRTPAPARFRTPPFETGRFTGRGDPATP